MGGGLDAIKVSDADRWERRERHKFLHFFFTSSYFMAHHIGGGRSKQRGRFEERSVGVSACHLV